MSAEAAFYNNFGIRKYFFRQNKMISILSISFVLYEKYMSATTGKATDGQKEFFLVHLLKLVII